MNNQNIMLIPYNLIIGLTGLLLIIAGLRAFYEAVFLKQQIYYKPGYNYPRRKVKGLRLFTAISVSILIMLLGVALLVKLFQA